VRNSTDAIQVDRSNLLEDGFHVFPFYCCLFEGKIGKNGNQYAIQKHSIDEDARGAVFVTNLFRIKFGII
jgi:hypothetical protein